jgi:hypothetical protein
VRFTALCRERKWKLGQAKRFGRMCARSNLDLESRAAAKAKQEAAAIRRRSAWIAKEVRPPYTLKTLRFLNNVPGSFRFERQAMLMAGPLRMLRC